MRAASRPVLDSSHRIEIDGINAGRLKPKGATFTNDTIEKSAISPGVTCCHQRDESPRSSDPNAATETPAL